MDPTAWIQPDTAAAAGGWVLFAALAWLVLRKMISGDLVTRREADAKDEQIFRLRESNDHLHEQLGKALTALEVVNDVLPAFRAAAEETPRR